MVQYKVKRRPKSTKKKLAARAHHQHNLSHGGRNALPDWNDRFHVTTSHNNH